MTETELRNKVVSIAKGWLGKNEGDGSFKKIIDLYNSHPPLARGYKVKYTDEWCATFVSAVFIEAGLTDIAPTECSCSKMIALHKNLGQWKETDAYVPDPGDIIMYDWQDTGSGDNAGNPDHVGIVESVSGTTITIIEGNKGQAVARRKMTIGGRYIRGYCLPSYSKKASTDEYSVSVKLPQLERGSNGKSVKALQILLNGFGCDCGTADGSFGPKTTAAVKTFQTANKLTADGIVGHYTWTALLR